MTEPFGETGRRLTALREDVRYAIEQAEATNAANEAIDIAEDLLTQVSVLRDAALVVSGDRLDHWAECPLPPDAGCVKCDAWFAARRVLTGGDARATSGDAGAHDATQGEVGHT